MSKNVSTKQFLEAFGYDEINFRVLNGISQEHTGNYSTSDYDKIDKNLKTCNDYWKKDIYFIVNNGGHTLTDINRLTAQFADFDAGRLSKEEGGGYKPIELVDEWKAEWKENFRAKIKNGEIPMPSIVVETRNGFHVYWLYDLGNTIDLSIFTPLQIAIASKLGSDGSIKDLPRIMRLPNFFWAKHSEGLAPYLTTILSFRPEIRYTAEKLQEYFHITEEEIENSCETIKRGRAYSGGSCAVNDGNWFLQFRDGKPIEVEGFYENGQVHAACPRGCGDSKGHDIVITSGSQGFRAFCNRCKEGAFASQDKNELFYNKRQSMWEEINLEKDFSKLSPQHISMLQSSLDYKDSKDSPEDYFNAIHKMGISPQDIINAFGDIDLSNESILKKTYSTGYAQLKKDMMDYEDFPIDVFPAELHPIIRQSARKNTSKIDYTAVPLLVTFSTAIGTKYKINSCGFSNNARLWGVGIGSPSSGKTTGAEDALRPLPRMEAEALEEFKVEMARYINCNEIYKDRLSIWKKDRSPEKGDPPTPPVAPVKREFVFEEGTIEGVRKSIDANSEGILCKPKEFYAWMLTCAKYSGGSSSLGDLLSWQSFWDNDFNEPIKPKRAGRDNDIPKHYMSFYSTLQDDCVLKDTIFQPILLRVGWTHRFMLFNPEPIPKKQLDKMILEPKVGISSDEEDKLYQRIVEMTNRVPDSSGCWDGDYQIIDFNNESKVAFDDDSINDAFKTFNDYYIYLKQLSHSQDFGSIMTSFLGRQQQHLFKMLLVVHLIRTAYSGHSVGVIDMETVTETIRLSKYFISHFLKLYDVYMRGAVDSSKYKDIKKHNDVKDKVINWLRDNEGKPMTASKMKNNRWVSDVEYGKKVLQELEIAGFGELKGSSFSSN